MRSMRWASLFALLCFSFLVSLPAFAAMQAKPVEWKQGKQRFSGYLVYNDSNTTKRPGLMMVPDWKGVTPASVEKAKLIANAGYVVLVADVFGKGVRPKDDKAAGALVGKIYQDLPALRARAAAALDFLRSQAATAPIDTNRIGAFGFCFGGKTVLELARSGADLAGVVSFHGGLSSPTPADAKNIKAKVLVCHGADDPFVPADEVLAFQKEMREAKADWQFVAYGGAVHSFTDKNAGNDNSKGAAYHAQADLRSWREMKMFLDEVLR